jgi:hypothetical protein
MHHYARLACVLADALQLEGADFQDAKGEAWIQLGVVFRILGHLQSSLQAFASAEEELSNGSLRPDLQARLFEWRASLYRDWRKFDEAEKSLATAVAWHSRSGSLADSHRCLISLAIFAG